MGNCALTTDGLGLTPETTLGSTTPMYESQIEMFSSQFKELFAPKPVPGTDYMLETNIRASDIENKIRYIMDLCNVDYENIVITYVTPMGKETEAVTTYRNEAYEEVLKQYFKNGFHTLFLGILDKTAGIDHDRICFLLGIHDLMPASGKKSEHFL